MNLFWVITACVSFNLLLLLALSAARAAGAATAADLARPSTPTRPSNTVPAAGGAAAPVVWLTNRSPSSRRAAKNHPVPPARSPLCAFSSLVAEYGPSRYPVGCVPPPSSASVCIDDSGSELCPPPPPPPPPHDPSGRDASRSPTRALLASARPDGGGRAFLLLLPRCFVGVLPICGEASTQQSHTLTDYSSLQSHTNHCANHCANHCTNHCTTHFQSARAHRPPHPDLLPLEGVEGEARRLDLRRRRGGEWMCGCVRRKQRGAIARLLPLQLQVLPLLTERRRRRRMLRLRLEGCCRSNATCPVRVRPSHWLSPV